MSNEQTSGERTHGRHDSGQQPLHRPIHDNKSNGTAQHYGIHCVEQDASTAKEAVPVQPPLSLDIFAPMSILDIPIPQCDNHPVSRNFIRKFTKAKAPLQTNKFYENFILGGQDCAVWTHPYSLSWAKGQGNAGSWGMAVSHIDREQLAFGPPTSTGAAQYYINPIGIQSIIFSAKELGQTTSLTLDSPQGFSANANLSDCAEAQPTITFPLVQGMGFVTAIYNGCIPLVQTSVFFQDVYPVGILNNGLTSKFRIVLEDGNTWLLYFSLQLGVNPLSFTQTSNTTIEGPHNYFGVVQVAKLSSGCSEEFYDRSAGAYAVGLNIPARVCGNQGTYTLTWDKAGSPKPLLMYALPHHVSSFTEVTKPNVTPLRLMTTTKGMATGVLADVWQMEEHLPIDMGFTPWMPWTYLTAQVTPAAAATIAEAGKVEAEQDVLSQCNVDNLYFSGKGLAKFAMMAIALNTMAGQKELAKKVLDKLKQAFDLFVQNKQKTPLVYDRSWGGVVSKGSMENAEADFGNAYYNDHHFHYGYFVYTAAVIGYLDPAWLQQGSNLAWVNMLVRDFASPIDDSDFPFQRSFDWFHGHSWAKGLFESADGKDEESTSEDAFASYALKMWGRTSRDANLEARGNLMLAIQARVFQTYFLMEKSNSVQPPQVLANKVTGITFENKCDHATYFGMNIEYIQGIHMIPLAPCSALVRAQKFVQEEWDTYFSNGRVDQAIGGWRGILYANLALVQPRRAWQFFAQQNFDWGWLDGGASRTWYLAWCAALGGD